LSVVRKHNNDERRLAETDWKSGSVDVTNTDNGQLTTDNWT